MSAPQVATILTAEQARTLTDEIKGTVERTWALLLSAHEQRAWRALGYDSWREYAGVEFGMSQSRAYQLLDAAKVVREIEAAGSTSVEMTEAAARDLKPHLAEVAAAVAAAVVEVPEPERQAAAAAAVSRLREAVRPMAKVTESTKTETVVNTDTGEVLSPEQWAETAVERAVVEPTNADLDKQLQQALGADHQFLSNLIAASDPKFLHLPPHRVIETYRPGSDDAGAVDNFLARLDAWLSEVQAGVRRAHLRSVR